MLSLAFTTILFNSSRLVAIFDADKEGILRSEGALIQTIGRAARNINGKAILYGDNITNSMKRAIDETNRRRKKQELFNSANNIKPRSIIKDVPDIMEGARASINKKNKKSKAQNTYKLGNSSPEELSKIIIDLEKKMHEYAHNLEFEKAAELRDRITSLNQSSLGIKVPKVI